MRLGRLLIAGAGAALCCSAARAQEVRVEAHGGYTSLSNADYFRYPGTRFLPVEGGIYGIGLGYDARINDRLFAGIEANADFNTGARCQVNPAVLAPGIFESCLAPQRDLSANARFGIKLRGARTRIYALAGYSNLRLRSSSQFNRGPPLGIVTDNRDGARFGAGVEQSLGRRFYSKVEYRFSDYAGGFSQHQALVGIGLRFGKR